VQLGADELKDSLIRYPLGQATPQTVMTDLIEKFLQIEIHHNAEALSNIGLGLGERLMGIASWPQPAGQAHLAMERVFRYSAWVTLPPEAPCIDRRIPHGYACALLVS
jgi:hypothetical protein